MTTSIRILRQEMKWTEGGYIWGRRGEETELPRSRMRREGGEGGLFFGVEPRCSVVSLTFAQLKIPQHSEVCVRPCPVHLTSLNSNNVFSPINVLWIREYIIDLPAQPYCSPSSTLFTCCLPHCCTTEDSENSSN